MIFDDDRVVRRTAMNCFNKKKNAVESWHIAGLILLNITGIFLKSVDVNDKDDEDQSATTRREKMKPLLEGNSDASNQSLMSHAI